MTEALNKLTLKEYSKEQNISYEAVRQSVNRYKEDLKDHIIKINKTQYLDNYAIKFLNDKRKINPVIIYELNKDEKIKALEEENKRIHILLEQKLIEIDDLKNEKIQYLENKYLIESSKKELEYQKQQVIHLSQENEKLKEELKTERDKGFFKKIFGNIWCLEHIYNTNDLKQAILKDIFK